MSTQGHRAAFPRPCSRDTSGDIPVTVPDERGMTMREWLAAMAMQGMLARAGEHRRPEPKEVAVAAVGYADALLAELAKGGRS